MGACNSRPILNGLEDIIFSLGSLYSFIVSHLSAVVNRFYSLLLSPIVRVDDENVPSRLCDEKTGVCLRPKDRLRQRKKTEMRMKRAELAARGLDPNLALRRRDSRTSNADTALGERVMKRWSRADSVVTPQGGQSSSETSPVLDEKIERGQWPSTAYAATPYQRERRSSGNTGALKRPVRSGTAPPGMNLTGAPAMSKSSPLAPSTSTTPREGLPKKKPQQKEQQQPVHRRLDYRQTSEPPQQTPARISLEHTFAPVSNSRGAKGQNRLSLQTDSRRILVRREDDKDLSSVPVLQPSVVRSSLDTTAVRPPPPLEALSRARQSLDVQLREHSFARTQTMPSSMAGLAVKERDSLTAGSGEPSPRSSVSDLASAACNVGAKKKQRKMWRDEVDRVARSRVKGVL